MGQVGPRGQEGGKLEERNGEEDPKCFAMERIDPV